MARLTLYPAIAPYRHFTLAVDAPHVLYVEECGNPAGLPVVFLHGGPGAGCENYHRRFFDPARYRIILFDQRGCGRSTPHAELSGNTTPNLVADIERLRMHLGVTRWVVFGGSWGSTLALAYAQAHPDRVLGLVLRGIFLCRDQDIRWFYQDGASHVFPDFWQDYIAPVPLTQRQDMVSAYYALLTGADEVRRMAAAKAWSVWEGRTATLYTNPDVVSHFGEAHVALSLARIECHYFMNHSFMEPDQLVRNAHRLRDIPGVVVHGRYDMVCPVDQAHALHQAWPQAELRIIPDAGHSATEPGIVDVLIQATRALADRYA
jgi:proline iminopeptidase